MDILDRCGVLDHEGARKGKELLVRIVAMLTRMIERGTHVREGDVVYGYVYGYVNENENVNENEKVNENGNERQSGNQRVQATRNSSRLTLGVEIIAASGFCVDSPHM